jgi:membrane protein YqaA with SNARE-associated domain
MIKKIYANIIEISKKKYALSFLLIVAFLESFIFPIPPDIFLIFLILAQKNKAFYLAFYCTVLSVAGGILGYFIGSFFFDSLGQGILNYYNLNEKFLTFSESYNEFGALIVAAGGFTPIPYKIITIFSGFVKMDFFEFTIASVISRGARFFLIATLLYFFGKKIEELLIKKFGLISLILFLIIIITYFIIKT